MKAEELMMDLERLGSQIESIKRNHDLTVLLMQTWIDMAVVLLEKVSDNSLTTIHLREIDVLLRNAPDMRKDK